MMAENKVRDVIKALTEEEKVQALSEFTDGDLLQELANRLNSRARSLDAVIKALQN